MKKKVLDAITRIAASSPVVAVAIALLELALDELKRHQHEQRQFDAEWDDHRRRPMQEVPWDGRRF